MRRAKNMREFRKMARQAIADYKAGGPDYWTGYITRETPKAVLFKRTVALSTGEERLAAGVWLPKSQITIGPAPGADLGGTDGVSIELPQWLARAKA